MNSDLDQFSNPQEEGGESKTPRAFLDAADLLRFGLEDSKSSNPSEDISEPSKSAGCDSLIGEVLEDRYVVHSLIGEGGFGEVYLAEQAEPVKRQVAIKVLKAGQFGREILSRFEGERQALALMSHPNIAKVFDAGTSPTGRPFFVMEYVVGQSLTDFCDQHHLRLRERLRLFQQVCDAVQHAHQRGVIHRDLKPSNVIVEDAEGGGVPRVIDFGIAKATNYEDGDGLVVTRTEMVMGTPAYMSPEQAELGAAAVDTRSDVYSLGVILYELFTGLLPVDLIGLSNHQALQSVIDREPIRPSRRIREATHEDREELEKAWGGVRWPKLASQLRGDLDHIVLRSLEKNRDYRYASPKEFSDDIAYFLEDRPVRARTTNIGYQLIKLVKRRKQSAIAFAALLVMVVFGVIAMYFQGQERKRQVRTMLLAKGDLALEQDDVAAALSPYVHAMALERSGSVEEETHRYRIGAVLASVPRITDMWFAHDRIWDLDYHPTGSELAVACNDGEIKVFQRSIQSDPTRAIEFVGGTVHAVRYSPSGRYFAAGGESGLVMIWELDGAGDPTILSVPDDVHALEFIDNDQGLFAGTKNAMGYYWKDWKKSRERLATAFEGEDDYPVHCAVRLPSGGEQSLLLSLLSGPITLWDATTDTIKHEYHFADYPYKPVVDVHESGKWGITGYSNFGYVWDLKTEDELWQIEHEGAVRGVAFSLDGKLFATGGDDRVARVWSMADSKPVSPVLRHEGEVTGIKFDPRGGAVVTASDAGVVRRWDLGAVKWHARMLDGRLSADRRFLYEFKESSIDVSGGDGSWELQVRGVGSLESLDGDVSRVFSLPGLIDRIFVDEAATRLIGVHAGDVTLGDFNQVGKRYRLKEEIAEKLTWQVSVQTLKNEQLKVLSSLSITREESILACDPSVTRILVAKELADASTVRMIDTTGEFGVREQTLYEEEIKSGAFFTDDSGRVLVIAQRRVYIWDFLTGSMEAIELENPGNYSDFKVKSVSVSTDHNLLAICTNDGGFTDCYARVWSLSEKDFVGGLLMHRDGVTHANFSPDGKLLATSGEDGSVKLWSVRNDSITLFREYAHADDVARVRFSDDGRWLVTVTGNGARVWDVQHGGALAPPVSRLWGTRFQIADARFFGDDESILVERGRGDVAMLDLSRTDYQLDSLQLMAELWSCTRIGGENETFSLRAKDIASRWEQYLALNESDQKSQN